MSSDDVTITEHENGDLTVTCFDGVPPWHELDAVEAAALEKHYRARFAAERMPEDVKALLINADEYLADHRNSESWRFILALRNALEAAYAQTGADDDPR